MIKTLNKPKLGINKKKLEEITKYFYKLRHKFSTEEVDKYKKVFCDIKSYRYLSESEIEEVRKYFNKLEKSLMFKKFHGDIIVNQLAEEFKGELNCIRENMQNISLFLYQLKKECDNSKKIAYKLRFIDSFKFMSISLSNLLTICL